MTPQPMLEPARKPASDSSPEELVSTFVTDAVMTLAIALLVYIPAALGRLGPQEQQRLAGTTAVSAAATTPLHLDVRQGAILIRDGTQRPAAALPAEERVRYRGRSAAIQVHGNAISSDEMTELGRLYNEFGFASWSFQFTSPKPEEVSR